MQLLADIIGWIGMIALTTAYLLISRNKISAQTYLYQGLNLLGSICLIINSTYYKAYPSTALNIIWVGIGIFSLYKIAKLSKDEKVPGSQS